MRSIFVSASSSYEVKIGRGLLSFVGEEIRNRTKAGKVVVIAGENVFPLYGESVVRSLQEQGLQVAFQVIPSGEKAKTLKEYEQLLYFFSNHQLTRSDAAIALGGGATGDLTGFTAATYQRGMKYVQIPTTLLAAVDSSVGGKTAVNLPGGKNQVGAFYQPAFVLCDPDVFETLPERDFFSGCAEVIKYAILFDEELFSLLSEGSSKENLEEIIARCVQWKADIVKEDEFDTGKRRLLNLGHTFGHALETESRGGLLHGEAVSIGMATIARASKAKGYCSSETCSSILALLKQYHLPTETEIPAESLTGRLYLDKKIYEGKLNLIVPERIGHCKVLPIPKEDVTDWLHAGGIA